MLKLIIRIHLVALVFAIAVIVLAKVPGTDLDAPAVVAYGVSVIGIIGFAMIVFYILRGIKRALFGPIQVEVVERGK